jgi:hypothetical protein
LDRARDELFSHIQRCGVLDADSDQKQEWLDDTIEFLAERYADLSREELGLLRTMGENYCSPAIPHGKSPGDDPRPDEAESAEDDGEPEPSEVGAV